MTLGSRTCLIGFFINFITWSPIVCVPPHLPSTLSLNHDNPSDFLSLSLSPSVIAASNSSRTSTSDTLLAAQSQSTNAPQDASFLLSTFTNAVEPVNSSPERNTSLFISPLASNHSPTVLAAHNSSNSKLIISTSSTSPQSEEDNRNRNKIQERGKNEEDDELEISYDYNEYEEKAVKKYFQDIHEYIFPSIWKWALIVCNCLVFVVGLLGNILVCVAVYRNYAMRTVTNYFIVNLAVADFLVILFCLPPTLIWDVTYTWFFGDFMCKAVLYIQTVSITVSVLTLTFISIDRWYAICYPLRFKSTTRRAQTAICIIWFISLSLDIPELFVNETLSFTHELDVDSVFFTQCIATWDVSVEINFIISRIVLLYILPLILMSVFYTQIIRVLWQSGTVTHNGNAGTRQFNFSMVSNASTRGQLRSRKKAAKMLVIVVGMFAVCFLPLHILTITRLLVKLSNSDFNIAIAMISHWLCYANSAMNPIIYNFMSGKFRKEFRRAINCAPANPDFRLELNTAWRTQIRKALNSSLGRSDTNRTTITSTT